MRLTLVRHAPAEPRTGPDAARDAARTLTARGRRRLRRVRKALRRAEQRYDCMLFSPLARSQESAEVLMPLVDGPAHAEPTLAVPPRDGLLEALAGLGGGPRLHALLVGHQPHLAALASWLVWGRRALGSAIDLKKGGAILLEGTPRPRGMQLVAVLPPELLTDWAR
jgi:phosphohistidine phosphatase